MKDLFKTCVLIVLSIVSSWTTALSQEGTTYFFQGYTYQQVKSKKSPCPYLTVVLHEVGSEQAKAVSMSNGFGDCSFYGVPIDIYKDYKLSVYAGDKLLGVYLRQGFREKPSFPGGNINTHTLVPSGSEAYSTKILELPKGKSLSLRQFLTQTPELELEEDMLFLKGGSSSLRIFINHATLPADKLKALLNTLDTNYISRCELILYKQANPYFAGAINILLTIGQAGSFPDDTQYINTLPQE